MTKLLVSVRDAAEALIAANNGADIVDVKEPRHGTLGFAAPDVIGDIVRALRAQDESKRRPAGDVPISIAMGELADLAPGRPSRELLPGDVWSEIRYAKVGCQNCPPPQWSSRWDAWRSALPPHVLPVAVAYADHGVARSPLAEEVLEMATAGGTAGFLLDTFAKKSSHLFDFFSRSRLDSLRQRADRFRLLVAVAGSLRIGDLTRALELNPDVVGVRGAACEGGRESAISARNVRRLAAAIDEITTAKTVSRLVRHDRC